MIMTVTELRQFVTTSETDQVLSARLAALELLVRSYTNNNFQVRSFRSVAVAVAAGKKIILSGSCPFRVGDTLQITESDFNSGLVTISAINGTEITVAEDLIDESGIVVTKVAYPADVKMGAVNLMRWELENREKTGVASETISRHSVTYVNMDGNNSLMGYPVSLMGFLKPYMKARFGQGLRV